jgi:cytochrome c biogenesis protein CcmG, thiol:disulfide interchange protein DsbE
MSPLRQSEEPKPSTPTITYFIGLLALVAIVMAVWAFWPQDGESISADQVRGVGATLQHLNLQPLTGDGRAVSLKDVKDHVLLLNFWGTWCGPCRLELPHIAQLKKRYAGREAFRVVAISYPPGTDGDDVQALKENTAALLKRFNLELPTYYDPRSDTVRSLTALLDLEEFGFPTTLLLDRRGTIRAIWFGYRKGVETEMERYVGMILDEEKM